MERKNEKVSDQILLPLIHDLTAQRPSYGYRRVTELLLREMNEPINAKRVYRIMKQTNLLLQKYGTKPSRTHDGKIETIASNIRWSTDGFGIQCWNG